MEEKKNELDQLGELGKDLKDCKTPKDVEKVFNNHEKNLGANQSKCTFPGCVKDKDISIPLAIGSMGKTGLIEFPDSDRKGDCNLCEYHAKLAEQGLLNLVDQGGLITLVGAFPLIEIVEGVIKAKGL